MSTPTEPIRACIVILNYGTAQLTIDCLASLEPEIERTPGVRVAVVDNCSPDDSPARIEAEIDRRGWERWASLLRSTRNGGFAAGNNTGIRSVSAEAYILLNSDTIVRPGAIGALLDAARNHPEAGVIGPRLEWPDGRAQESAFRYRTPRTELLGAAGTGLLTRLFGGHLVAIEARDDPFEAQWVSFACALISRDAIERVGLLDEGYFMYMEDADYCRRARRAGFAVLYWPHARVVHLRGGTSSLKADTALRTRRPAYYYASRARYYAKFYGLVGLWAANLLWGAGRLVSLAREAIGSKAPHTCAHEWTDNWTNWRRPAPPARGAP